MGDSDSGRLGILSHRHGLRTGLPICRARAASLAILARKNEASVASFAEGGESNQGQRSKRVHFEKTTVVKIGQRK